MKRLLHWSLVIGHLALGIGLRAQDVNVIGSFDSTIKANTAIFSNSPVFLIADGSASLNMELAVQHMNASGPVLLGTLFDSLFAATNARTATLFIDANGADRLIVVPPHWYNATKTDTYYLSNNFKARIEVQNYGDVFTNVTFALLGAKAIPAPAVTPPALTDFHYEVLVGSAFDSNVVVVTLTTNVGEVTLTYYNPSWTNVTAAEEVVFYFLSEATPDYMVHCDQTNFKLGGGMSGGSVNITQTAYMSSYTADLLAQTAVGFNPSGMPPADNVGDSLNFAPVRRKLWNTLDILIIPSDSVSFTNITLTFNTPL